MTIEAKNTILKAFDLAEQQLNGYKKDSFFSIDTEWFEDPTATTIGYACGGIIDIRIGEHSLTSGRNNIVGIDCTGRYLSAYSLAFWLLENFWYMCYEDEIQHTDVNLIRNWKMRHCITAIGEGYVWPNITIFACEEGVKIVSNNAEQVPDQSYTYNFNGEIIVPLPEFKKGIDNFVASVLGRIEAYNIRNTILHELHTIVLDERMSIAKTQKRIQEAVIGKIHR